MEAHGARVPGTAHAAAGGGRGEAHRKVHGAQHALVSIIAAAALASCATAPQSASVADLTGRVTAVETGDTLTLATSDNRKVTVRLSDIGAPVGSNFYAPSARQLLSNMVQDETVRVAVTAEGGPDRAFGHVYRGLLDVNLELVKAGAAWFCSGVRDQHRVRALAEPGASRQARPVVDDLHVRRSYPLPRAAARAEALTGSPKKTAGNLAGRLASGA